MKEIVAAGVCCLFASSSHALVVGLYDGYMGQRAVDRIVAAGHTCILNPNPANLAGIDTLVVDRRGIFSVGGNANVQSWLHAGGRIVTEFSATDAWFDGGLATFDGILTNGFAFPSGTLNGGNTARISPLPLDLTAGLPATWGPTGDAIGTFRVWDELDPRITIGVRAGVGNISYPVAACAPVGLGVAVMFFTDFGDIGLNGGGWDNTFEERLFRNALTANCVPAAATWAPALAAVAFASRGRRA